MINYLSGNAQFTISYPELKEKYQDFVGMSDVKFMENINDALHLACVICWFKGIPTYACLNDTGIVHELIHLLNGEDGTVTPLSEVREKFKVVLELV